MMKLDRLLVRRMKQRTLVIHYNRDSEAFEAFKQIFLAGRHRLPLAGVILNYKHGMRWGTMRRDFYTMFNDDLAQ